MTKIILIIFLSTIANAADDNDKSECAYWLRSLTWIASLEQMRIDYWERGELTPDLNYDISRRIQDQIKADGKDDKK